MKFLTVTLILFLTTGCRPSPSNLPESQPQLQPNNSPYYLDTVLIYHRSTQEQLAKWIEAHPEAEIISISTEGDYHLLIVYKIKTGSRAKELEQPEPVHQCIHEPGKSCGER